MLEPVNMNQPLLTLRKTDPMKYERDLVERAIWLKRHGVKTWPKVAERMSREGWISPKRGTRLTGANVNLLVIGSDSSMRSRKKGEKRKRGKSRDMAEITLPNGTRIKVRSDRIAETLNQIDGKK